MGKLKNVIIVRKPESASSIDFRNI